MNIDSFWKIIDDAKAEAGQEDQTAMLKCTESRLSNLPANEIVEWFNIHHLYLDLAERKDLEYAASQCGIYLSDDSFLYFRGWLLSQGREVFSSVLNDPNTLSKYVKSPDSVRFEEFVYAGHGVYQNKAFLEEYGDEGMEQFRKEWLAKNPDKGEFGFDWALGNKYSLWDASAQHPLSDDRKDEIRTDLFAPSANKTIEVVKTNEELKDIEKILLAALPADSKEYRNLSISLFSGYNWGFGMLPAASQSFHQEMGELFKEAGWEHHEPKFENACPEYSKGKSRLYCHPTQISGPCEKDLVSEVCQLVSKATTCMVTKAEDRGRIFDITQEQYNAALEILRPEIERDLLKEFSLSNRNSDSDRHKVVMMKYRVLTLQNHTDTLSSALPYWKFTEDVLADLIAQKKIVKRPESNQFTSRNYITAPVYQLKEKPSLDYQIKSVSPKTSDVDLSAKRNSKHQTPER